MLWVSYVPNDSKRAHGAALVERLDLGGVRPFPPLRGEFVEGFLHRGTDQPTSRVPGIALGPLESVDEIPRIKKLL